MNLKQEKLATEENKNYYQEELDKVDEQMKDYTIKINELQSKNETNLQELNELIEEFFPNKS